MNYLKLTFKTPTQELNEILTAHLADYEFNGFDEENGQLVAYIEEKKHSKALAKALVELSKQYEIKIDSQSIVNENWNAKWESNYEPVIVDDFCAVRANFHASIKTVRHEIIITPKMSFGTGHHATTYMMMKRMESLDFKDKNVLDYGCGTAVLAILAQKLGAFHSDAVDNDHWAYENSIENVEINRCANEIDVYCGSIDTIGNRKKFDVVLANINRNVILDTMQEMTIRLKRGGYLVCSGFLEEDVPLIVEAAAKAGLKLEYKMEREKWRCLTFL